VHFSAKKTNLTLAADGRVVCSPDIVPDGEKQHLVVSYLPKLLASAIITVLINR